GKVEASQGGSSASGEFKGVFAAAVGTYPVGEQFGVFGKIGLAYTQTDVSSTAFGDADDNSTGVMFGVGGKFSVTKNLSVRVEWERFAGVGETSLTDDTDVDLLSVGVVFKF
ncbi:MAG: outer membrane protein, partial [Burkholderiales bacterium]